MAFDFNKLAKRAQEKLEEAKETLEVAKVVAKPLLEQAKAEAKALKDDLIDAAKGDTTEEVSVPKKRPSRAKKPKQ